MATTSNQLLKGLSTDRHPKYQEEGTYRYAMNAVVKTGVGETVAISNEEGNESCSPSYPAGKVIIGSVALGDERVALFFYDPLLQHEIGIFNTLTCVYTTKVTAECLNFNPKFPINAIYKKRQACEDVIYFTDTNNEYREINLSNIVDSTPSNCEFMQYSQVSNYTCLLDSFTQADTAPKIDTTIVTGNGNLELGTYYFAIRYLDSELNPTDFQFVSRSVAVGNENYDLLKAVNTIAIYDGGSNDPNSPYYVPPSNKAIKLRFQNVDQNYEYLQVAVIKRTADSGAITGVDVLSPVSLPISGNTFIYTGLSHPVEYTTSLDEILSKRLNVNKVGAHTFFDNKLYLGNVTSPTYDFSIFQRFASKIKVEWIKDSINSPIEAYSKHGRYYFSDAAFMEDEVYSLGVVFIMDDDTESPVFHIPGRGPNTINNDYESAVIGDGGVVTNWDTELAVYGESVDATRTKRWQNISTAANRKGDLSTGLMGYWETLSNYPDIPDCTNHADGYWGRTWQNEVISPAIKVRHHRMPASFLRDSAGDVGANRVGIRFSNVSYPSGVKGHRFVYGKRTDNKDKTILAKGMLFPIFTNNTIDVDKLRPRNLPHDPPVSVYPKLYAFVSPDTLLKGDQIEATYLHVDKIVFDHANIATPSINTDTGTGTITLDPIAGTTSTVTTESTMYYYNRYVQFTTSSNFLNHKINFLQKINKTAPSAVEPNEIFNPTSGLFIKNPSTGNDYHVVELNAPVIIDMINSTTDTAYPNRLPYVSLKTISDPFTDLFAIRYTPINSCVGTATTLGMTFDHFGGDTFVMNVGFTDYNHATTVDTGTVFNPGTTYDTDINIAYNNFYCESSNYNYSFRHGSKTDTTLDYFKWNYDYTSGHPNLQKYIINKAKAQDNAPYFVPESYNYNNSYSFMESINEYFSLPRNYDYCSDCEGEYPHRLYASQIDSNETSADGNKIIRVNDYVDLDGSVGPITDLFVNFNKLYATTTRSIFMVPTRPQSIETSEQNIYIGTGAIFSIPPVQLKVSDYAFGGQSSFSNRLSTHYGTFYIDDVSGYPLLLTDNIRDLSLQRMHTYFQENSKSKLKEQFYELSGIEFPINSRYFAGYGLTYDPRYKRVLITKKDFRINDLYAPSFIVTDDEFLEEEILYFVGGEFYINRNSTAIKIIPELATDIFENHSYTISYSFEVDNFVSWHSYLPHHQFNNSTTFFTTTTTSIYRHGTEQFQNYYGVGYSHIIDFIVINDPREVRTTDAVYYSSRVQGYSGKTKTYRDVNATFDNLVAYNDTQSTGKIALNLHTVFNTTNEGLVRRTDNQWRLNKLRDATINSTQPIWDMSWEGVGNQYFIDRVPNADNIDLAKSQFEQRRMRDHYLGLRFYFASTYNYKITTDLISTINSNRNR